MAKPKIFDISLPAIFSDAVDDFQAITGYALERSDAERLMLQNFSNSVYEWGSQWLEASAQNYLEYMTEGAQLDAYGGARIPRLLKTPSKVWVRAVFTAELESFLPIHENTVVTGSNDKGTFTFKTTGLIMAPEGSSDIDIEFEEFIEGGTNSGALANDIEIASVDTLIDIDDTYNGIIDSVASIAESHGGHNSESNEHYKKRLQYREMSPSTAGPREQFILKSLGAHHKVLDVGLLKPFFEMDLYVLPVDFKDHVLGDASAQISDLVLSGLTVTNTDNGRLYWSLSGLTPTRTLNVYDDMAKTSLVAQYLTGANGTGLALAAVGGSGITGTFDLVGSTDDTDAANYINTHMLPVAAVEQLWNPTAGESAVRPINDQVNVYVCAEETFTISTLNIKISSGNKETIEAKALQLINLYRTQLRSEAGKHAVKSQIGGLITNIPGVYTVDIVLDGDATKTEVSIDDSKFLTCPTPTITSEIVL